MIIIIAAAVLFAVVGACADPDYPIGASIFGISMGTLLGFMAAMVVGMFAYTGMHKVDSIQVPLVTMQDGGSRVHGAFFLGSGVIDSDSVYTWYEKNGENSFVQRRADVDVSTVHYLPKGSGTRPYYVQHWKEYNTKGFLKAWGLNIDSGKDEYSDTWDFYVPNGSITQSYVLDAK